MKQKNNNTPTGKKSKWGYGLSILGLVFVLSVLFTAILIEISLHWVWVAILGFIYIGIIAISFAIARAAGVSDKKEEELKCLPQNGDCIAFEDGFGEVLEFISYDDNEILTLKLGDWKPRMVNTIICGDNLVEFKDRGIIKKISKEELQNRFYDFGYNYSFKTHTATNRGLPY